MTPEFATACDGAVHVMCSDGQVLRAGRACMHILSGLGWPRTAALFSLRPFIWFVELGYRVVASNRVFFNSLLFRR
ncbi:MAG: putative DCC family thiol-disulfide oxidoreductase YuxK [Myxococcota bacterium]|jgi:predicted DCC family thiol-disulfide oxidoreductase YuxK